jgi:hypothetical protein
MGLFKKIKKGFKSAFKGVFKNIKKVLKNPGRALKKGLGKMGEAFGKLGPMGTLALSLMLPGIGALWGSFGTWASGLTGVMGNVMTGVANAGNALGRVYSSITGFVKDTVGAIGRNTIGKIPVGKGQNLNNVYDNFSSWVGKKTDSARMKIGIEPSDRININKVTKNAQSLQDVPVFEGELPTMNVKQTSILEPTNLELPQPSMNITAPPVDNVTTAIANTTDSGLVNKMQNMNQTDWDSIGVDRYVDRDFTTQELSKIKSFTPKQSLINKPTLPQVSTTTTVGSPVINPDYNPLQPTQTTQIITDINPVKQIVGNDIEIVKYEPTIRTVKLEDLTEAQLDFNNENLEFINFSNKQHDNIFKDSRMTKTDSMGNTLLGKDGGTITTNNPDYGQLDVMKTKNQKLMSAGSFMLGDNSEDEFMNTTNINVTPLTTDVSTSNDYQKDFAPQFADAGYGGPQSLEGFMSAGFYGNDPFTLAHRKIMGPVATPLPQVS